MARDIGDELFRPLVREVRDLNVKMGPSSDVVRKLKRKKGDDRGGVTDMDRFDGEAPSATSRPRDGGRNDGRDARGRFVGDGNRPWVDRESIGLDQVAEREGVDIIRDQVAARHATTGDQIRYYDGLFRNRDGSYTGIEVKSGSASRNPAQRLFDGAVSVETPAVANLPDVGRINIVQVVLERVP